MLRITEDSNQRGEGCQPGAVSKRHSTFERDLDLGKRPEHVQDIGAFIHRHRACREETARPAGLVDVTDKNPT